MYWEITPAATILSITAVIVAAVAALIWRRRTARGGTALFWLMGSVFAWAAMHALEAASIGFDQKLFWSKLSYLGITTTAPLFLVFSVVFLRKRDWLKPSRMALFWAIPLLTTFLAATNEFHALIWTKITIDPVHNLLIYQHGPAFWLYTAYAYLCVTASIVLLINEYWRAKSDYKGQIRWIVASSIFPWVGNVVYLFGFDPIPGLDTTVISFAITSVILTVAVLQSHLLDLLPIAHDVLLQHMEDGVIVMDVNNRVIETNPAAAYLLNKLALPLGGDVSDTFQTWPALLSVLNKRSQLPREILLTGNFPRYLEVRVTPIINLHGRRNGYLAVMHDITNRKRVESALEAKSRELERMSVTDDLSSLYNRRYVDQFLAQEFERCERYATPLSLALIDVDDFKDINDSFGHYAGDEAIRYVAEVVQNNLRNTDRAARLGGDEFLAIMPHTTVESACPVIERIRERIENEIIGKRKAHTTISAGVTSWIRGDTPDEALKRVDKLLYQAKSQGKNCIVRDD